MLKVYHLFFFDIKKIKMRIEKANFVVKKIKVFTCVLFYNKDSKICF